MRRIEQGVSDKESMHKVFKDMQLPAPILTSLILPLGLIVHKVPLAGHLLRQILLTIHNKDHNAYTVRAMLRPQALAAQEAVANYPNQEEEFLIVVEVVVQATIPVYREAENVLCVDITVLLLCLLTKRLLLQLVAAVLSLSQARNAKASR